MNNKGFTLIELLTVISIVAILAAITLVTFPAATGRARDTRVINAMQQYRTAAEVFRGVTGGTYTGLASDATIVTLTTEINANAQSSLVLRIDTNGLGYCAEAPLRPNRFWCVDSNLFSGDVGTTARCTATGSRCS